MQKTRFAGKPKLLASLRKEIAVLMGLKKHVSIGGVNDYFLATRFKSNMVVTLQPCIMSVEDVFEDSEQMRLVLEL
jgi:hypothetical protein